MSLYHCAQYYQPESKINKLNLQLDIQPHLFDNMVLPILLYGREVWGFQNLDKIELFHRSFLKKGLKISKYSAKDIVYGETGRHDVKIIIHSRMNSFWNRIQLGNNKKISKISL